MTTGSTSSEGQAVDEALFPGDNTGGTAVNVPSPEIDPSKSDKEAYTANSSLDAAKKNVNSIGIEKLSNMAASFSYDESSNRKTTYLQEELLNSISQIGRDRVGLYKLLVDMENHYLVQAIYDVVSDEMIQDTGSGSTITITCEDPKLQEMADEFMESFNISDLVEEMIPLLLHYGDYSYRVKSDLKRGITQIDDPWCPGEIVPVYSGINPIGYFRFPAYRALYSAGNRDKGGISILKGVTEVNFDSVWHTSLMGRKTKINLDGKARRLLKVPHLKIGKSFIQPALERLQLLKFREITDNAQNLSRLTRPTLIGVQVPKSEDTKSALRWVNNFEKLLNSGVQDITTTLSGTEGIVAGLSKMTSGRYKAVPTFESGRGNMNKLPVEDDIANAGKDNQETIKEERDLILNLVAVPPELVYNSSGERMSSHKMYARYSKRVKSVSRSVVRSVKQLLVHHCAMKLEDPEISTNDFGVTLNVSSNMEDMDNAEVLQYALENIGNVITMVQALEQAAAGSSEGAPEQIVPREALIEYAANELAASNVNAARLFDNVADKDKKVTTDA